MAQEFTHSASEVIVIHYGSGRRFAADPTNPTLSIPHGYGIIYPIAPPLGLQRGAVFARLSTRLALTARVKLVCGFLNATQGALSGCIEALGSTRITDSSSNTPGLATRTALYGCHIN
jgi:hypothetical protein